MTDDRWNVISYTAVIALRDGGMRHEAQVCLTPASIDPVEAALDQESDVLRSVGTSEKPRAVRVMATDSRDRALFLYRAYAWTFTQADRPWARPRVEKLMRAIGVDEPLALFDPANREAVRTIDRKVADEMDGFDRKGGLTNRLAAIYGPTAA